MTNSARSLKPVRVLLLSLIFPPDGVSTAQLLGELAVDLNEAGLHVEVLTTTPHYNVDAVAQAGQPLEAARLGLASRSSYNGIPVTHVAMPAKAAGRVARSLQWLWFHIASFLIAIKRRNDYDVILTVSPPLTIAVVAAALRKLTGKPFVFLVWELYPEILVRLDKLKRGSVMHKLLSRIEKFSYEQADSIGVLHEPMGEQVAAVVGESDKIVVLPTFADTDEMRPLPVEESMRSAYDLEGKFVVGYAGNLGVSQDLAVVLQAAKLLAGKPEIAFVIAGDGTERARLEELAEELQLKNVMFLGQLPYLVVPELTATFDVGLVVLSEGVGAEALPSKTYKIMACGRPVLAVAEQASPLVELVLGERAGFCTPPGDAAALAKQIADCTEDQASVREAGDRAREVALNRFSRSVVTRQYVDLLQDVARS